MSASTDLLRYRIEQLAQRHAEQAMMETVHGTQGAMTVVKKLRALTEADLRPMFEAAMRHAIEQLTMPAPRVALCPRCLSGEVGA